MEIHDMIPRKTYYLVSISDSGGPPYITFGQYSLQKVSWSFCVHWLTQKGESRLYALEEYEIGQSKFIFENFDEAKQFCIDVMEQIQECLDKEILSVERISKESLE